MGSPQTASNFNLQRSLWPQKQIIEQIISASPTLMALPKDPSFYEQYRYLDEGIGAGQGLGADFTAAKNNKGPDLSAEFRYSVKTYYSIFSIDGLLMRRAKGNSAVLVQPYARRSELAMKQAKRDLSRFLFGNGGGSFGQISSSSNVSTNTITLANVNDCRFFARGMYVTSSTTDGTSGSIKSGRVKLYDVIKSGTNKGQLICEEASWATGIGSVATSDYLFRESVFGNVWNGFAAHIPSSAPSGSFLGVDRTRSQEETAGVRTNAVGKTPVNALMAGAIDCVDMFGEPDLYIVNTSNWDDLRKDLANVTIINVPATGYGGKVIPGLGYNAIQVMGPRGKIDVIADPDCPVGRGYLLTRETWKIASMGELMHLTSKDPREEDSADAWESRFVSDSELICEGHGQNCTIQLASGA